MSALTGNDPVAVKLCEALGLPKHTIRFELSVAGEEIISVRCEYQLDAENAKNVASVLAEYRLYEKSAPIEDGLEIADSCARSDIECNVPCCQWNDLGKWYDMARTDPKDKKPIDQAVRYLTARGLIERQGDYVRFKA